jgi:UDP-N-acetyl-D-galactosamine dehydrogenase
MKKGTSGSAPVSEPRIAVIGLGYVGLPLALALARKFPGTVGFDIDTAKIRAIRAGKDPTREGLDEQIQSTSLEVDTDPSRLRSSNFFIVTVPTPVDQNHQPDLKPLYGACETVGKALSPGAIVVFESTVYPGLTEELCGPWLEKFSGLLRGQDFFLGYSPERMNPGDKSRTVEKIVKVVAGENDEVLRRVSSLYESIVTAGVHRAPSIKVAEAAKVIENTQRDLNIALMNELAIIFDRLNISTRDVLEAASTKWNFLRFTPGLVGGHCIGVDPYYLTTKAEQSGYHPEVILAGRRINDGMGAWLAQRMVKLLVQAGGPVKNSRIGVLGITFKEDVSDIRNSRVPDVIRELREFGVETLVHDPIAQADLVHEEYGLTLNKFEDLHQLDGVVLAVSHSDYLARGGGHIAQLIKPGGILMDVKSVLRREDVPSSVQYWSL